MQHNTRRSWSPFRFEVSRGLCNSMDGDLPEITPTESRKNDIFEREKFKDIDNRALKVSYTSTTKVLFS